MNYSSWSSALGNGMSNHSSRDVCVIVADFFFLLGSSMEYSLCAPLVLGGVFGCSARLLASLTSSAGVRESVAAVLVVHTAPDLCVVAFVCDVSVVHSPSVSSTLCSVGWGNVLS